MHCTMNKYLVVLKELGCAGMHHLCHIYFLIFLILMKENVDKVTSLQRVSDAYCPNSGQSKIDHLL
jgi:hypothetical protein